MNIVEIEDLGRVEVKDNSQLMHKYLITINVMQVQNCIDDGKCKDIYDKLMTEVGEYFGNKIFGELNYKKQKENINDNENN